MVLTPFLAISFTANAQTNDPAPAQAVMQHAANLPVAEAIVARAESLLGRQFEPNYRAEAVRTLTSLSPAQLAEIRAGDGAIAPRHMGRAEATLSLSLFRRAVFSTRAPISSRQEARPIFLTGGLCGVPFGPAVAVAINFVAVNPGGVGDIRVTPFGTPVPLASVLNYTPATFAIANGIDIKICDPATSPVFCGADITVQVDSARQNRSARVGQKGESRRRRQGVIPCLTPAPISD